MGSRKTYMPGGLLIPGRFMYSNLTAKGSGATDSSYTEKTARPGTPLVADAYNRIRLRHSGGQGYDYGWSITKAGMPGLSNGVEGAWKLDSEAAAAYRGWDPPNVFNHYAVIDAYSAANDNFNNHDSCTIPSNQHVIVMRRDHNAAQAESYVLDPDRSVGSVGGAIADQTDWNYPALCVLPESERVLCMYGGVMWYSDDEGTTWTAYSRRPLGDSATTTNYEQVAMAYYRGDIVLFVVDSANDLRQYASSDLGANFELVDTVGSRNAAYICVSARSVHVVYRKTSDSKLYSARLGSAWEPLSRADGAEVNVYNSATGVNSYSACADPDGMLWCHLATTGTGEGEDGLLMRLSRDDGQTWEGGSYALNFNNATDYFDHYRTTAQCGMVVFTAGIVEATAATSNDSLVACWFGGWSNVTFGPNTASPNRELPNRGGTSNLNTYAESWLPFELPSVLSATPWTLNGAAVPALATDFSYLGITTVANTGYYTIPLGASVAGNAIIVGFELGLTSGGALGTNDVALRIQLADAASYDYLISIRFTTTGYRVYDDNAAAQVGADQTVAITTNAPRQFLVRVSAADSTIEVYDRPVKDSVASNTVYTVGPAGAITDNGATSNTTIITWGHVAAANAVSRWYHFFYLENAAASSPFDLFTGAAGVYSRPLTPYPIPLSKELGDGTLVPWVAATGGTARYADTVAVAVEHDYGVQNMFPEISPSPSVQWRSSATTEHTFVFDLGDSSVGGSATTSWVGGAIGLCLMNCNMAAVLVEYYTGAVWTTAATVVMTDDEGTGWTTIDYTRSGDTIYPSAASDTGPRWLFENELAGSFVRISTQKDRRIVGNSAGLWSPAATTTQKPHIRLDGIDGTEAASGSNASIYFKDIVAIAYPTSQIFYRYWRVRILNNTINPDGEYRIGSMLFGRVVPFGVEADWTRGVEVTPNTELSRSRYGTLQARKLGPPRRTWRLNFNSGIDLRLLRQSGDIDYHGTAAGNPLTGDTDHPYLMHGLLEVLNGGGLPCVCIEQLPTSSVALTDRTRFLYSRITSSLRTNGVSGDVGVDELLRMEGITFEEIV